MALMFALQSAAPWIMVSGAVVLTFSLIAYYRFESVPLGGNRRLVFTGAAMLLLGLLAWVAPYVVVFLAARPA